MAAGALKWLASLLLLRALGAAAADAAPGIAITVNTQTAVGAPPALGLGWEMWVMFGYFNDMADARFIKALSGLSGMRVRVGGITADFTVYDVATQAAPPPPLALPRAPSPRGPFWPTAPQNLTAGHLRTLLGFFQAAGLTAALDLSEFFGRNCSTPSPLQCYAMDEWCTGAWDMSNVRSLLQYLHDNALAGPGKMIEALELGNELQCHLSPATNLADVAALGALIQDTWRDVPSAQRPAFFAPSTDSCSPAQLGILAGLPGLPGVTGFSFHSYPGGGGISPPLSQLLLNETWLRTHLIPQGGALACIEAWQAAPRAAGLQLWVTESSSSYATDVPAPAQDSFLNGFFSLAEWGQYSLTGVTYLARWALSESSPFATVMRNASRPGWDASHDYHLLRAFQLLVGGRALGVAGGVGSGVLCYAYCARAGGGAVVLTAINTRSAPQALALGPLPVEPRMEWVFTAPGGNLSATMPLLNGLGPPLRLAEDGSPPALPGVAGAGALVLPPLSQAFFLLSAANAAACA